jgi:hypothetical protein
VHGIASGQTVSLTVLGIRESRDDALLRLSQPRLFVILVEFRARVTPPGFTTGGFPREQEVQTTRRRRCGVSP